MSILAEEELTREGVAGLLIWGGLAVVLFSYAVTRRSKVPLMPERWRHGLKIFLIGLGVFLGWLLVQIVIGAIAFTVPGWFVDNQFTGRAIAVIAFIGATIGIAGEVIWLIIDERSTRHLIGVQPIRVKSILGWAATGSIILFPLVTATMLLSNLILKKLNIEHPDEHQLLKAMHEESARWVHVLGVISAVLLAPIFEEILFRGFVQTGLKYLTGRAWIAIVMTSLIFAIIHEPWTWLPIFALSMLMGAFFEYSRSLWVTILMHATFNTVSVALWSQQ